MIITVEGNIGAGKTSLLYELENAKFAKEHIVAYEPVDDWLNVKIDHHASDSKSLFELYYMDKQKYGFAFQMYALQTRFKHLVKLMNEHPDKIIIMERCHLTDSEIFAKMLYSQGYMSPMEYHVYKSWYDFTSSIIQPNIAGVIYLRVSSPLCVERICERNRDGEGNIDMSYIKRLHQLHEEWLATDDTVCIIDGNANNMSWDIEKIRRYIDAKNT
jgi:deoxyadenosine/deoxycytidine kinase